MKDLFIDYAHGIELEKARIRELRLSGLHRQAESAQRAVDLESALLHRDMAVYEESRMRWAKRLPFTKRLTPWAAVAVYTLAFGFAFSAFVFWWSK